MERSSLKIRKLLILSGLSSQNVSLRNFFYVLIKKLALKKFLIVEWHSES